jgi:hypothetical protein
MRDDLRERRLTGARRTREDNRWQPIGFDRAPQQFPRREDMLLADELLDRARAHARGERRRGGWCLDRLHLGVRFEEILHALRLGQHERRHQLCRGSARNATCSGERVTTLIVSRKAGYSAPMRKILFATFCFLFAASFAVAESLPFSTVFKGQDKFKAW